MTKSPVRRTRSGARALTLLDDALEEVGLGVLVEVDVADLDDAVAVEGRGEVGMAMGRWTTSISWRAISPA